MTRCILYDHIIQATWHFEERLPNRYTAL